VEREKIRQNLNLSKENVVWLKELSKKTGISMSLFVDTLLTGTRMSLKEDGNEREAVSMALEQLAKSMRQ